jgi:hypothetical protein
MVTRLDERYALADPLDDAGALVAEDAGRIPRGVGPGCRVQVGVTDAAGDESDEHLTGPRIRQVDLLHDERLTELLEHRGTRLHRSSSGSGAAIVTL